jgi:F420-dependent oxidoreductase-like protein
MTSDGFGAALRLYSQDARGGQSSARSDKENAMQISLIIGTDAGATLDDTIRAIVQAEQDGFATAWVPNIFSHDALTVLALAGRETSRIELGTAVVPTYPRHPHSMAQQAATANAAAGGRVVLGLGRSHKVVIESMLGLSYDKPVSRMREYVTIVRALSEQANVAFDGDLYKVHAPLALADGKPFQIMVGALMPNMLTMCGELCDGTLTWMTGPAVIADRVVPTLERSSAKAGRPMPRVVCSLPVCVTDDPDKAHATAAKAFEIYGTLPVYRACLDAEGAASPADIAVIGNEQRVREHLERVKASGASDFYAAIFPEDGSSAQSRARSYEFLKGLGGRI